MTKLPELDRDKARYSLKEARQAWAHVFGDAPLRPTQEERRQYRDVYSAAEQELRDAGIVREETHNCVVNDYAPFSIPARDPLLRGREHHGTRIATKEITATHEYVPGIELANLADSKGARGAFGFDDQKPTGKSPRMREDARVNLLVLIGILAEMLADRSGPSFRKADGRLNKNSLHAAMTNYAESKGLSSTPVGKTQFSECLNEAAGLLR